MLYGLKKIGVMGGHGDGANQIPKQYAVTPELAAYREGTAMRQLAIALAELPGVTNLRPEAKDISWTERAKRLKDAGCDLGLELHTNWSINGKTGKPNTGVFLVIVAMHNPVHEKAEQEAMAEQLFAPLAAAMGMRLEVRTKDGTGGDHDWYSFIDECNDVGIPYPFIVEHGYHIDYASNEAEYRQLIAARYAEITETVVPALGPTPEPSPAKTVRYIVGVGLPRTKAEAQLRATELATKGYNTYVREGYFVQVGSYSKEANALSELLKLQAAGIPDASMMTFVE